MMHFFKTGYYNYCLSKYIWYKI